MKQQDAAYHRARAKHCLILAEQSPDAEVRRRHEQLAELHTRCIRGDDEIVAEPTL